MSKVDEFFQNNEIEGALSPEQAVELMGLAEQGDTDALPSDECGAPGAAPAGGEEQQKAAEPVEAKVEGEGSPEAGATPVLMAKDNVHTIPYERLLEAREGEKTWKAQAQQHQERNEQLMQELESLRAQAQQRVDEGKDPTAADVNAEIAIEAIANGVDPSVFGDMDEEGIARGVAMISQQAASAAMKPLLDKIASLEAALAPIKSRQQEDATASHFAQIQAKHPDFESVAQSKELADWIAEQPSFVRDQMNQVVQQGSTEQVIELLDAFKGAGKTQTAASGTDAKAAAQAAIEKAKPAVPVSLSDIPGGTATPGNRFDSIAGMGPAEMADALAGMSPDQVEAFLSRSV